MTKGKKIFLVLAAVGVLLTAIGVAITYLYSDEIKQYGVTQINQLIKTEISVQEIEFSVFKRFPSATLIFHEVEATEVTKAQEKGRLFNAEKVFLEFNIVELLKGNYSLTKIAVENGAINLKINAKGESNYDIFKESEEESEFALNLKELLFENIQLSYVNEIKESRMEQFVKSAHLKGQFSEKRYELEINAWSNIQEFSLKKTNFIKDKSVFVDFILSVDNEKDSYTFTKAALSVQDLHFYVEGDFTVGSEADLLNFSIGGNGLSIESLLSLFPETYADKVKEYKGSGEVQFNALIQGLINNTLNPKFSINFKVKGGNLQHQKSGLQLGNINLSGSLDNGAAQNFSTTTLLIDSVKSTFGSGSFSGSYSIRNFDHPLLKLNISAKALSFEEILEFFPNDSIETLSGNLDLDLNLEGRVEDLGKLTVADFRKSRTYGKARVSQFCFSYLDNPYKIDSLEANLEFNNNDVKVSQMTFALGRNDFNINGFFKNLIPYIFAKDEYVMLRASYTAKQLYLGDFLSSASNSSENSFALPNKVSFDLSASIDEFHYKNFLASQFTGKLQYSNQNLIVPDASFSSMQGRMKGKMQLDARNQDKIALLIDGVVEGVDITELFQSFDEFGQSQITSKNLKGICFAEVSYSSYYNHNWEADLNSIEATIKLRIERGELLNYQPVYALSRFIEVEELNHIKFSSLENEISIANSQIIFPEMSINSSALNLNISGKHSFNNEIEYHFNLLLRDILSKKARKAKKENEEFGGHVVDDGLGRTTLFLKMTGTVDDPKITYDKKGLREEWKKDLQEEKETIKKILKEEFGKNTSGESKEEIKEYDFQMEWEEGSKGEKKSMEEEEQQQQKKDEENEPKKKSWLDKITTPNTEEYEEAPD